jgi:hypothetical protein
MMLTTLTLLLLSAEPGPSLVVVATAEPGLEKVAAEAGRKLGSRLEAPHVELGGYLKSRSSECQKDLRCLVAAPGLSEALRMLHLRLRPLSSGRIAADLRLVDLQAQAAVGRSASVVEPGELAAWAERAAARLLSLADPYTQHPPTSPFAVQAPSSAGVPDAPPPPDTSPEAAEPSPQVSDEE